MQGVNCLENQCLEWKETWRDEYVKVICGFANADGGTLEIGRRDNGEVIGGANFKSWGKPEPFYEVHSNDVMIGFNTELQFGEKFGEKFGENQTQIKVLEIMLRNPKVSAKAIGVELGITTRGAEKVIRALKNAGLIERVGAAKGGHWIIK
jgi:predicted HTH transcriptional regulator